MNDTAISTQALEKSPESQVVIRFQDCDAFGHLNNASFIHYFINAREDHLRQYYGFDLYEHARTFNKNWYITRHEIAYLRPAQLGETVTIKTHLIDFSDRTVTVEGIMYDNAGKKIKAVQWTTFRYVDLAQSRSATHPDFLTDLLQQVVLHDIETAQLDTRIREIKKSPVL